MKDKYIEKIIKVCNLEDTDNLRHALRTSYDIGRLHGKTDQDLQNFISNVISNAGKFKA